MKKLLSLMLSAVMAFSLMAVTLPAASAASSQPQAVVTQLTAGKNTVYLYVPESELGGLYTCATAPCFMVFGDKAYTAETAKAEAEASGLAKLAAQEGATVAFINPQGNAWSDADVDVFLTMQDMYTDSSNNTYENGMAEDGSIMGAVESRVYLYANGSGADFVAANYMKYMSVEQLKGNGDVIPVERSAASINLFNVKTLPEITERADLAVAVINGPANAAEQLAKLTDKYKVASSSEKGFDSQWITGNYETFSGAYRRQANVTLPIHNYQAEGIVRNIKNYTLADGSVINYVLFHSKELNVGKNAPAVPLVLLFHGGGNTALGVAQTSEWPEIAKANGFLVVSVDRHVSEANPNQVAELLAHLKQELPIDASRVYASGFSMGGVKSWGMFDHYPTLLAGIAPLGAVCAPESNTSTIVPVFYVGGQASPLAEMAVQNKEKAVERFENVFKTNQIAKAYNYNAEENKYWGMNGDIAYQVTDHVAFKDSTLNVNLYQSSDGKYYTAFGDATNQSHEVYARNCWAAWDFLSQFSRSKDGSIVINSVIYAWPSDNGNIVSNSYNQTRYDDVAANAPYAEAVRVTTEAGIFTGVGSNKFDPSGMVTRAQAVTALARLAGVEQKTSGSFSDVPKNAWYAGYVSWAVENGLVQTGGSARFLPNELLTGAQLNQMLQQYAKLAGIAAPSGESAGAGTVTRAEFAQQLSALLVKN